MNNIGEYLKNTRTAKKFSIEDVAEATGIRAQYLDALEKGEYSKIPGDVFIKGFIRNYGNYLGLDGNDLVEQYKSRNQEPSLLEDPIEVPNKPEIKKTPEVKKPKEKKKIAETQRLNPQEASLFQEDEEPEGEDEATEYEPKKKGGLPGAWADLKAFVIDNIYETVEDDDEDAGEFEEEEQPKKFVPVKEQIPVNKSANKSSFFSFRVFGIVFVLCMVIFTGVMGYFMFGGKSSTPVKVDTGFSSSAKSAHSSDKTTGKAATDTTKQDPAKKTDAKTADDKKKDEKQDSKTLGLGEGVTVEVSVLKPCWTQVTADGKTLEAATLQPGTSRVYKGSKEVKLNVGSIRFVKIKVNGKEVPVSDKEWGEATKVFTK